MDSLSGRVIGDKYKEEPAGAAATGKFVFLSTDAVRHTNIGITYDLFQRVTSPEKKLRAGSVRAVQPPRNVMLDTLEGLLRPSGCRRQRRCPRAGAASGPACRVWQDDHERRHQPRVWRRGADCHEILRRRLRRTESWWGIGFASKPPLACTCVR